MRKIQLTAWFATLAFGVLTTACHSEQPTESSQVLFDQFADPSSEFRTKPFMVWNTEITPERIDRILNEYKEQGCGGVFIAAHVSRRAGFRILFRRNLYHYRHRRCHRRVHLAEKDSRTLMPYNYA